MGDPQKRNHSSVNVKEKDPLEDLELGNDFFSWKSISMTEGDALDFDLTPVSKGNKKPFNFEKAKSQVSVRPDEIAAKNYRDMDFNLDSDFAKISSFNLDMPDLDMSPPLKKDAKSKEKSGESSSGKDKSKTDRFAFEFDFDELENFSFGSSREKGTKAERDKNNCSNESGFQDKEPSTHINETGSESALKDGPKKPSLTESRITFDMDCLVGDTDLEPTRENFPSDLAKDEGVPPKHPAAIDAGASDKSKSPLETTESVEILNANPSEPEQVDLEACIKNDEMPNLSSDSFSNNGHNAETIDTNPNGSEGEEDANMALVTGSTCNYEHTVSRNSQFLQVVVSENIEPSGGDSSTVENKVSCEDTDVSGSNSEQDANMILVADSTSIHEDTSKNSQHLQAVTISENICGETTPDETEGHVEDDRERTELGQTNSHVANSSTTSTISGITDKAKYCTEKDQEPILEPLESSLVSQPADQLEKQTDDIKEPLINSSRPLIQSDKPEYPVLKASAQATSSSLSSKQMGFAQPSLVDGRAVDATQRDRKLASLSLQCSKTLLMGKIPQIQSQKSCINPKIHEEAPVADRLRNGSKLNDSNIAHVKEMVKTNSASRQREQCTKDLDTLSVEANRKAVENRGNPKKLASIPSNENNPPQGNMACSIEGSRKAPDLPGLKLSRLSSINSKKSPIWRESRSVETSSQKSVLLCKSPPGIAHIEGSRQPPNLPGPKLSRLSIGSAKSPIFSIESKSVETSSQKNILPSKSPPGIARIPDKRKQTSSALSAKRTLEDTSADTIALYPSKRLSPSTASSRSFAETSEMFLDKKATNRSCIENDRIKSTKEVEILSQIRNDSNIKHADACSKELDDLCNKLKKKHDDAKELLVQAIVNSNKLLLLNNPQFKENIRATQNMFARLTLSSTHG